MRKHTLDQQTHDFQPTEPFQGAGEDYFSKTQPMVRTLAPSRFDMNQRPDFTRSALHGEGSDFMQAGADHDGHDSDWSDLPPVDVGADASMDGVVLSITPAYIPATVPESPSMVQSLAPARALWPQPLTPDEASRVLKAQGDLRPDEIRAVTQEMTRLQQVSTSKGSDLQPVNDLSFLGRCGQIFNALDLKTSVLRKPTASTPSTTFRKISR